MNLFISLSGSACYRRILPWLCKTLHVQSVLVIYLSLSKPCLHLTDVIDTEAHVSCRPISGDAALSKMDVQEDITQILVVLI